MKEQINKAINKRNDAVDHRGTKENMMNYYLKLKALKEDCMINSINGFLTFFTPCGSQQTVQNS